MRLAFRSEIGGEDARRQALAERDEVRLGPRRQLLSRFVVRLRLPETILKGWNERLGRDVDVKPKG